MCVFVQNMIYTLQTVSAEVGRFALHWIFIIVVAITVAPWVLFQNVYRLSASRPPAEPPASTVASPLPSAALVHEPSARLSPTVSLFPPRVPEAITATPVSAHHDQSPAPFAPTAAVQPEILIMLQYLTAQHDRREREAFYAENARERARRGYWLSTDLDLCGRSEMLKVVPFADGLFPVARFPLNWKSRSGKPGSEVHNLISAFVLAVSGVGRSLRDLQKGDRRQRLTELAALGAYPAFAVYKDYVFPNRWSTSEGIFDLLMMEFLREKDASFRRALIASVTPVNVFAEREFEDFAKGGLRHRDGHVARVSWVDKPVSAPKSTPKAHPNPPSQKGASM
eukprot:PhM_4_TR3017/c2_g7_i1/m.89413